MLTFFIKCQYCNITPKKKTSSSVVCPSIGITVSIPADALADLLDLPLATFTLTAGEAER